MESIPEDRQTEMKEESDVLAEHLTEKNKVLKATGKTALQKILKLNAQEKNITVLSIITNYWSCRIL